MSRVAETAFQPRALATGLSGAIEAGGTSRPLQPYGTALDLAGAKRVSKERDLEM